jgi:hypothetical protein
MFQLWVVRPFAFHAQELVVVTECVSRGPEGAEAPCCRVMSSGQMESHLELPILFDTLDRPIELLTQRLGEEALNGDVELLREHDGQTRVDIVLL